MVNSAEIVESDNKYDFKKEINRLISKGNVKDIKFSVNPKIEVTYGGASYSCGENYYAMIIYE